MTASSRLRVATVLTGAIAIATIMYQGPARAAAAGTVQPVTAGHASAAAGPAAGQALPLKRAVLPKLPRRIGCYDRTKGKWRKVRCDSARYIRRHLRHPEWQNGIASVSVNGSLGPAFKLGAVELEFQSVGTETDSKRGANVFSIQSNTNFFTGTNSQTDWVQFTDQSRPGQPDLVCVWQIDVSTNRYYPTCTNAPWNAEPRGLPTGQTPIVGGAVLPGGKIAVEALLPWSAQLVFTVIVPDKFGLASGWHGISGSILGFSGSKAVFSSAELNTQVSVSSCSFIPKTPCGKAQSLTGHVASMYSGVTAEANNLIPVIGSPPTRLATLLWYGQDLPYIDYVSTTTGQCPTGTKPPWCL